MILTLIALSYAQDDDPPAPSAPTRIEELSLVRVESGDAWEVQDGRAHPVDARTWAILTGNPSVLQLVDESRKKGRRLGWGLVVGGGAVALSSMIPLFTLEDALEANESTPGFDELGTRNDIRVGTAFSLLGAGAILAGSGLASFALADHHSLELPRHLDAATVDAGIAAYNTRLAETLHVDAATPVPVEPPAELTEPAPEPTAPVAPAVPVVAPGAATPP
jgi:hypothetical protein